MSGVDPECHPQLGKHDDKRVCARCFSDGDLKALIALTNGQRGCNFCGRKDAPTAPFVDIASHFIERLNEFYSKAGDNLPYESREGGYQGWHVDTRTLLTESVGLDLPRDDSGELLDALE